GGGDDAGGAGRGGPPPPAGGGGGGGGARPRCPRGVLDVLGHAPPPPRAREPRPKKKPPPPLQPHYIRRMLPLNRSVALVCVPVRPQPGQDERPRDAGGEERQQVIAPRLQYVAEQRDRKADGAQDRQPHETSHALVHPEVP